MDPQNNNNTQQTQSFTKKNNSLSQYCKNNIKVIYDSSRLQSLLGKTKSDKILSIMCRLSTDQGVWITNGFWNEIGFDTLFNQQNKKPEQQKIIYSWGIYAALGLIHNLQPKIIQHISQVQFPNLLLLCLDQNNIQTIQPLYRARMNSLTVFLLNDNNITSIRGISRGFWPAIQVIQIYNNYIYEYFGNNFLENSYWPQLKVFSFGFRNSKSVKNTTGIRYYSIGNLCKLQTNSLQKINVCYDQIQRIKQKSQYPILLKKYDKFSLSFNIFAYKSIYDLKLDKNKKLLFEENKQQNIKEL